MTIDEALKILKNIAPPLDIETFRKTAKCYEALDIAIKSLEAWEGVKVDIDKEIKDLNEPFVADGVDYEIVELEWGS